MDTKEAIRRIKTYMLSHHSYYIIEALHTALNALGAIEQIRWERDTAIKQIEDYGVSFGEKADCVKVIRCKDCAKAVPHEIFPHSRRCKVEDCKFSHKETHFCSYAEPKSTT